MTISHPSLPIWRPLRLLVRFSRKALLSLCLGALQTPLAEATTDALICRAPALGPACGAEPTPWLLPVAGNPIELIQGNKYLQHTDVWPLKGAPLIFMQRHYNAQSRHQSVLGVGWSLHWDIRLSPAHHSLWLADGRSIALTAQQLHQSPSGDYQVQLSPQTRLWFNPQGLLIRWQESDHEALHIERYSAQHPLLAQQVRRLRYRQQQISFHYDTDPTHARPLLSALHGPFGLIRYQYSQLRPDPEQATIFRLQQVHYPDGRALEYHYEQPEQPHALTGYSFQEQPSSAWIRLAYWHYDAQGRAIFSARTGGTQWLRIIYDPPQDGQLNRQLISAQGRSDYRFSWQEGRWVFDQFTGAPCPGCLAWVNADSAQKGHPSSIANHTVFELYDVPPLPNSLFVERPSPDTIEPNLVSTPNLIWAQHSAQRQLTLPSSPWPELRLSYDLQGQLTQWQSSLTGTTHVHNSANHLRIQYANGDQAELIKKGATPLTVRFHGADPTTSASGLSIMAQQQAQQALSTQLSGAPITIQLHRHNPFRLSIEHPNEQSWWQFDSQQRLKAHTYQRHLTTTAGTLRWHYSESFEYDTQGQLQRHHLLEGGQLVYEHDSKNELQAIVWQPEQGPALVLLQRIGPGLWRHHNGLYSYYQLNDTDKSLWVFGPKQLLGVHQETHISSAHTSSQRQIWAQTNAQLDFWHQELLYDEQQRLVGASGQGYWVWDQQGQNQLQQQLLPQKIQRDPSGLPIYITEGERERTLLYNQQRRLAAVFEQDQLIAAYQHNAFGYRIHAYYPTRSSAMHHLFIFQQQQLVAEWYGTEADLGALSDRPRRHPIKKRYVYLGDQPIALIDYQAPTPQVYAIHSQFIGAPIALTNAQGHTIWQANYQPLGAITTSGYINGSGHREGIGEDETKASELDPNWSFPLRYPGHYADPVTGWHDNLLRTYDPQRGHYLEPDPLGPLPGQQPLGYARQQPWRWIDPLGLILFAFDGTRYDAQLNSNVWQFQTLYQETAYYQSGPGNTSYLDWDALTAWRAHQIVETQWQHLLNEILWHEPYERLAIDIIGFSRGAALGRHFAQQIMQHTHAQWFHYIDDFGRQFQACLQPRFIGLFDTVAQFGVLGSHNQFYQFNIAPEWAWVAHAVALNEYRQLFPLYAITPTDNRIQAGFIGAHRNIGGGINTETGRQTASGEKGVATEPQAGSAIHSDTVGDLAKISLQWMLWQARAVGLSLAPLPDDTVTNPLVHDDRLPYMRYLHTDRHIQTEQQSTPQWLHSELGQQVRQQAEAFIERFDNWQRSKNTAVGTVNLEGYYQWLEQTQGWRPNADQKK